MHVLVNAPLRVFYGYYWPSRSSRSSCRPRRSRVLHDASRIHVDTCKNTDEMRIHVSRIHQEFIRKLAFDKQVKITNIFFFRKC